MEEASELLTCSLEDNTLTVKIAESPAIRHLRSTGTEPCAYYIEQTRTLYSAMADSLNMSFNLHYYDDTGKDMRTEEIPEDTVEAPIEEIVEEVVEEPIEEIPEETTNEILSISAEDPSEDSDGEIIEEVSENTDA